MLNQITKGLKFGKVESGLCRLSMNGTAIKTPSGYKTYDVENGTLVNCADFVFDIADDMFFVFPANDVQKGDLILLDCGPCCVIEKKDGQIKVFKYLDSTIAEVVPESYMFLGNTFFFSKIVSLFGNMVDGKSGDINNLMKIMVMGEMFKSGSSSGSKFAEMLPMVMMMNSGLNFNSLFGGLFGSDKKEEKDGE